MKRISKILLALVLSLSLVGCTSDDNKDKAVQVRFGRVDYAAHGTKSFAVTDVVLADDKILAVYIDEYQFLSTEKFEVTPNGETMATGIIEGATVALGSKRVNNEGYSANMATNGQATKELVDGYKAVEAYVTGKTIEELEKAIDGKTKEEVLEEKVVSGSTLTDTLGYIESVIEAAKVAAKTTGVEYTGDTSKIVLSRGDYAAHGTKSFAITSVVTDGEKILIAYIDEIQFISADAVTTVANSEAMVTAVNAEATVGIALKRVNNTYYSELMASKGGATEEIEAGYKAVEAYVTGKTIEELEKAIDGKTAEEVLDEKVVSGSTLADTLGYIESVINATK